MLQTLVNGIIIGGIYALISIGFSLIYSAVRFHHLAYASIAIFGAYIANTMQNSLGLNLFISILLSSILTGITGVLIWKLIYKPLREGKNASNNSMIVSSFGVLIIMQNLTAVLFGNNTTSVSISDKITAGYEIFGLSITFNQIVILLVTVITVIIFELVLNKTKLGSGIRAVGQNRKLAETIGIQANKIINYTFFIGTAIATIGTSLVALEIGLKPMLGLHLILKIIVACIIGGMGSIRGALAGGLILGIAENFGIYFLGGQWQDTVAFSLLILFLIFKPQGLFIKKLRQ